MSRGDAAAATWIVRRDESRHRRACDVDSPRRRVAATPRLRRGETSRTPQVQGFERFSSVLHPGLRRRESTRHRSDRPARGAADETIRVSERRVGGVRRLARGGAVRVPASRARRVVAAPRPRRRSSGWGDSRRRRGRQGKGDSTPRGRIVPTRVEQRFLVSEGSGDTKDLLSMLARADAALSAYLGLAPPADLAAARAALR